MDVTEEFKLWMSVYTSQHTEPVVILFMVTDVNVPGERNARKNVDIMSVLILMFVCLFFAPGQNTKTALTERNMPNTVLVL